jgi:uncharacterized protein (DUF1800 family)
MKFLRGALAAVLCSSLCFPAPLALAQDETNAADSGAQKTTHRQKYTSTQLQGDARIYHALERFTFGLRPGDVEAARQMGLEKWFDQQLHPAAIDEADLNARLAEYPAMQWSTQELLFRMPSPAIIRQAANGKIEIPLSGTLHAVYENQIHRMQLRKAASPTLNATNAFRMGHPAEQQVSKSASEQVSEGAVQQAGVMQPEIGNAMAPAPAGQTSNPAASLPSVDPAVITQILVLPPEERVRRLQSMQPEEFEAFIKSLKPVQRKALTEKMTPDLREAMEDLEHPEQTVVEELFAERLARDIYSNAQLQEVMTDFWLNHFNVYLRKNEQMPYYLVSYEREVIRPHALGKFEDLLEAVAHSPAMLIYLDNAQSMGPDSPTAERAKMAAARRPDAKRQAPEGLNENYARELMELHTLGVNGGYTQADVIQVARVLTGWTVDRPQFGGGFVFNPNRHEPGTKKVMGTKIKENGALEGRELLHFLATRPATAQFLSRKLAVRFVSDDPPQALVDRMAKAYLASGGDIPTVLKTLFHSPEFWAASGYRAKVKTPLEYVVSAVRASAADVENYQPLVNQLRQMGMPLYGCIPPVGYKWDEADWVSTGALVDRMNFALSLAANRFPGITVEWAPDFDLSILDSDAPAKQVAPTPESEEARLEPMLVAGGVSDATRAAALEEFQKQNSSVSQVSESRPPPHGQGTVHGDPGRPGAPPSPTLNAESAFRMGHPGLATATSIAQRPTHVPKAGPGAPPDVYEREDQLLAGLLLGSPEFQRR